MFNLLETGLAKLMAKVQLGPATTPAGAIAQGFAEAGGHIATAGVAAPAACTTTTGVLLDNELLTALPPEVGPVALSTRAYLDTTPLLAGLNRTVLARQAKALVPHTGSLRNLLEIARHINPAAPGAQEAIASGRAAGIALVTSQRASTMARLVDPNISTQEAVDLANGFRAAVESIPYLSPAERAYQGFAADRVDSMAAQAIARVQAREAVRPSFPAQSVPQPFNPGDPRPTPRRPEFDQFRTGDMFLNLPVDHPLVVSTHEMVAELRDQIEPLIGPIEWNGEVKVLNAAHADVGDFNNAGKGLDCAVQIHEMWVDHPSRATFLFHELMHARSMAVSGAGPQFVTYLAARSFEEGIVEGLVQSHIAGVIAKLPASQRAILFQGEALGDLFNGRLMYETVMHTVTNATYAPYQRMEKMRVAFATLHSEFAGVEGSEGAARFYQLLMNTPAQQRLKLLEEIHAEIVDKLPLVPERGAASHAYGDLINMRPGLTRHGQLIAQDKQRFTQAVVLAHNQFPELGPAPAILDYPAPNQPIRHPSVDKPAGVIAAGALPPILPPGVPYQPWFPASSVTTRTKALEELLRTGGFTYHPGTGVFPGEGIAVSPYPDRTKEIAHFTRVHVRHLLQFEKDNADLLADPRNHVGGWLNKATGRVELDVSRVMDESQVGTARRLGMQHGQQALFNLRTYNELQVMSTLQRARWSRMTRAEREQWTKMSFADRRAWIREHTTPLGVTPLQREVDSAIAHYGEVIDDNVGRNLIPLIRGEADEMLYALRERASLSDIVVHATTLQEAQRELPRINAAIRAKKAELTAKGVPKEDQPREIVWSWVNRQGHLRAQVTSRYAQALTDILGTHGVHIPHAKEWAAFYPNASADVARLIALAGPDSNVSFPLVAALVAVTSGSKRWPLPGEGLDTLDHNLGVVHMMLKDWKEKKTLGDPIFDTSGNMVYLPDVGGPGVGGYYRQTYGLGATRVADTIEAATTIFKGVDLFRLEGPIVRRPKQTNFFRNLMGDLGAVTADRHANFLAFYNTIGMIAALDSVGPAEYTAIAASIHRLAAELKLDPSAVQAILWGYAREVYETSTKGRTAEQNQRRIRIWAERVAAGLPERPILLAEGETESLFDAEVYLVEPVSTSNPDPVQAIYDAMEDMDIAEMLAYVKENLIVR